MFFFSSRRRHTRYWRDWSSDVCSSDLKKEGWCSNIPTRYVYYLHRMHNMKINKINSIIATLLLSTGLITSCIGSVFADVNEDFSSLKSKYMVLMDYESGKVIYKKNADQKIYPASTTKVWTAYCVLEKAKNLDEKIKIENMPEIEGSSMYLEDGEVFTTKQLLESLLIHSSNDVAYVLAKHYGSGDEKKFIDFMNQEAKKYGFTHTHFNNRSEERRVGK